MRPEFVAHDGSLLPAFVAGQRPEPNCTMSCDCSTFPLQGINPRRISRARQRASHFAIAGHLRERSRRRAHRLRLLSILIFGIALSGCATAKPKPWEHTKPNWYERNLDTDDREFYRDFFFGR
jgi:hypothetical protein